MKFYTPRGDGYTVDADGNITRHDRPGIEPSGQWRFLGLQHVKRREFIPFADLPARLAGLDLRYKNGKPQYTVRDFDHGSVRTWGNTQYRGVSRIVL